MRKWKLGEIVIMKKKIRIIILAIGTILSLCACVTNKNSNSANNIIEKADGENVQNILNLETEEKLPLVEEESGSLDKILEEKNDFIESESSNDNNGVSENSKTDLVIQRDENRLEGYKLIDGREMPVNVTIEIANVLRGNDAYNELQEQAENVKQPDEDEEYLIVTFNISYDEGEVEELFMLENRASMEAAGLYFSLSNSKSNTCDMTSYLKNSVYNISLFQGQCEQGAVAFLQKKGNTEPLYFTGFGQIVKFNINENGS